MKVTQLINNNGNPVRNHFIIYGDDGCVTFQSYDSAIAMIDKQGTVHLSRHWDYSVTTTKYLGQFLSTNKQGIVNNIDLGKFKCDLGINGELIGENNG